MDLFLQRKPETSTIFKVLQLILKINKKGTNIVIIQIHYEGQCLLGSTTLDAKIAGSIRSKKPK